MTTLYGPSQAVAKLADSRMQRISDRIEDPNFGGNLQDVFALQAETTVMSVLWNQAANLVKDVSEPLKSIVNK